MDQKKHRITIKRAVSKLLKEYERAKKNPWIDKPVSKALYDTWSFFDRIEKNRNEKNS